MYLRKEKPEVLFLS